MFKVQFFAGDRASDVALILAQEIGKLSDDSGFVFCQTFGKTLRGDSGKSENVAQTKCYVLYMHLNCTIWRLNKWVYLCFPATFLGRCPSRVEFLIHRCRFSATCIYDKLKHYLVTLGIFNGETPHSFRSGCAITMGLANPRMSKEGIRNHVGWCSDRSERYYTRSSVLHDSRVVAQCLADAAASSVSVDKIFHAHADFSNLESPF